MCGGRGGVTGALGGAGVWPAGLGVGSLPELLAPRRVQTSARCSLSAHHGSNGNDRPDVREAA